MNNKLDGVKDLLETIRSVFGDVLNKAAGGWNYNGNTGNFLHPLHGAVKIRPTQEKAPGLEVVHNGKIVSSHGPEDKVGAIKSAQSHMRSLTPPMGKDEGFQGDMEKDDLDAKIKAKLKSEMDKRNFGEADATRHVIDRDRGAAQPKPPKSTPLLQSECSVDKADFQAEPSSNMKGPYDDKNKEGLSKDTYAVHGEVCKTDPNGQWKIEKSGYGPKGMNLYNQNDNAQRKAKNTGDVVADAGKNVNVKSYTTTGASLGGAASNAEAKRQKEANKKAPVKTLKDFSPEELATIGTSRKV